MQTYIVKRDLPFGGITYRHSEEVQLSERQARHLLIAGFIEKKAEKATAAPKQTREAPPKARQVTKRAAPKNGKRK